MNPRVLRRFIILMAIATIVMFTGWVIVNEYKQAPQGDYEVRQGDILIGDKKYDAAIERFDAALVVTPDHRGALMGRAISFLLLERYPEAEAEFTYLIDFLRRTLDDDDITGVGTYAAAFTNRAILYDRLACTEMSSEKRTLLTRKALSDYIDALKIDEEVVSGPGIVDKVIYGTTDPATTRKRATYLVEQLKLPENKRLLCVPEIDKEQRMHKP